MKVPLKLNDIDREHLQELYDAAGVARDELPYTPAFEQIWQGFQDRTFKNADREQLYTAMLKYVRSSSCPGAGKGSAGSSGTALADEQLKQLKSLLPRHARGGKIPPYSDEFEAARADFNRLAGTQLSEQEFWQAILRIHGSRRPTAARRATKPAAATAHEDEAEEDGE